MQKLVCIVALALAGVWPAGASDLSPTEQRAAQETYEIKCAKCHKFYNPADYSQEDWDMWMKKMSRKSKLKRTQGELLTRYLQTFRDRGATAIPPQ